MPVEPAMKRNRPIAAEYAQAAKPWSLPFWTETPVWAAEKEAQEADSETETDDDDVSVSDVQEIDAIPPTAEELETIRREAYNAGLEQGLIEGRQKGEQEGYEAGLEKGLADGQQRGEEEGKQQGFNTGRAEGLAQGEQSINETCERLLHISRQLKAHILERDQTLSHVMADLLIAACQQVLQHELSLSNYDIQAFVHQALQELPGEQDDIQIFLPPDDLQRVQQLDEHHHLHSDSGLAAGECRVQTRHSWVEFSATEHMQALLDQWLMNLCNSASQTVSDDFHPSSGESAEDIPVAEDTTDMDSHEHLQLSVESESTEHADSDDVSSDSEEESDAE